LGKPIAAQLITNALRIDHVERVAVQQVIAREFAEATPVSCLSQLAQGACGQQELLDVGMSDQLDELPSLGRAG
jgi:hypothetical protein